MSILSDVLINPETLSNLSNEEWDDLLRFSRFAKMMATLHWLAEKQCITQTLPSEAQVLLDGATVRMEYMQQKARFELQQIAHIFADNDTPIILLKGAAYIHAGLPPAGGRLLSDVDIMVSKSHLADVEDRFLACGWKADEELTTYDEHYYRHWSHEIPPIRHPFREVEIDIHHNITMPTSRIKLDADKLVERAVPVPNSRFHILCPTDMVLHSACHLLFNDELRGGLRDLWDMKLLCEYYLATSPTFYTELTARSIELGLHKPLYYALSALEQLLGLALPSNWQKNFGSFAPNGAINRLLSTLVKNTLVPEDVENLGDSLSQRLLYIRSHWVRMPPFMLTKHLIRKWYYQQTQKPKTE